MQEPKLFALLPEEYVSTPDGMEPDINGDLILSCPNFADLTMPSCIVRISKDGTIRKWFDVPKNPVTNEARSMGIAFGPDHDLYIVDNQGWTGLPELKFQGRILRVRMDGDRIEKVTTVAYGMEHPNGIRIRDGYMYVTQSTLEKVKTESGNLAYTASRWTSMTSRSPTRSTTRTSSRCLRRRTRLASTAWTASCLTETATF